MKRLPSSPPSPTPYSPVFLKVFEVVAVMRTSSIDQSRGVVLSGDENGIMRYKNMFSYPFRLCVWDISISEWMVLVFYEYSRGGGGD